ncbi:MAG: hypothetical protein WC728_14960 [Elusimicrobiota bacterium]
MTTPFLLAALLTPAFSQTRTQVAPVILSLPSVIPAAGAGQGLASPTLLPAFSAPASPLVAPLNSVLPKAQALSPAAVTPVAVLSVSGNGPLRPVAPAARPRQESLRERLGEQVRGIQEAAGRDSSGRGTQQALDQLFLGDRASSDLVNDEGIPVTGRAAEYYREVRRFVDKYGDTLDLSESLDVMDDSYGDVWAKLKAIEAVAQSRGVEKHNTHLEQTLLWVDGVIEDKGKRTAINTYRVYFHHAENPLSEIEEGIRRADSYLNETLSHLSSRGKAEKAMGKFDEVLLAFDTRGYKEVKEHLKAREKEVAKAFGSRFRFVFLDEFAELPRGETQLRRELGEFIAKYKGDEGLSKIIEGVIYSRYVGLLLELKTLEHFHLQGYSILQSGRELFDADGKYLTELDAVVRSPSGKVSLVEAKSARVPLPPRQVLEDKVVKKLETYAKNRRLLESAIGVRLDEVVFSFDVGSNTGLEPFLRGQEKALSEKYGFRVRFIFIESSPKSGRR